jgi:hypothetical protein
MNCCSSANKRRLSREAGFAAPPYTNLKSYQMFKQQGAQILSIPEDEIETESMTSVSENDEEPE